MGNHDDNPIGQAVFQQKHGGSYYAFFQHGDLFIVLNSIEADRAISDQQLIFLEEKINLTGDSIKNIFIFFHEIIWNSHEKYKEVRSNSRSRYDKVVDHSNYWEEVHPLLMQNTNKSFYLIAGDLGGNPDAISAFYDKWEHITFLASGMGEVEDENYLLIHVYEYDSVGFELVPLNAEMDLHDISYYSIPPAPGLISGPASVFQGSSSVEYYIPEVFNADSYTWGLPSGALGSSDQEHILLDFDSAFENGELSVSAFKDGFGSGPESTLWIEAEFTGLDLLKHDNPSLAIQFEIEQGIVSIGCEDLKSEIINIQVINSSGKLLYQGVIRNNSEKIQLSWGKLEEGLLFIRAFTNTRQITEKFIIH